MRTWKCLLFGSMVTLVLMSGCGLWPLCGEDDDCGSNEFCLFAQGDCGDNGVGICMPRPEACALIFSPVCGCDGQTYGNECEAWSAGVSVAADGPCE